MSACERAFREDHQRLALEDGETRHDFLNCDTWPLTGLAGWRPWQDAYAAGEKAGRERCVQEVQEMAAERFMNHNDAAGEVLDIMADQLAAAIERGDDAGGE